MLKLLMLFFCMRPAAMGECGCVTISYQLHECVVVTIPGQSHDGVPVVIWPQPILVEDTRFFVLRTSCDWLCRFATGRNSWARPLAKFAIVETVREAWGVAEIAGVAMTVNAKRKRAHRRGDSGSCLDKVMTLSLPRSPGSAEFVEVRAVRRARDIFLELTPCALTWLYQWCASEGHPERDVVRGGKDPNELSSQRGVFFSRAYGAWVARCKTGSKRFPVSAVDASGQTLAADTYRALLSARRVDAETWLISQGASANESAVTTSSCEGESGGVSSSYSMSDTDGGAVNDSDVVPSLELEESFSEVEDPF